MHRSSYEYDKIGYIISVFIAADVAADDQPHIVLILIDDLGWANVGYHRDPSTAEVDVDTPNIDSLVEQGLELNHHYAASVCAPSRSSLLSGRLPIHVNDQNRNMGLYNPDDPVSGMTTLGTKMKEGGYATHVVGKWNVGTATYQHTPEGRGFDSSLIYFSSLNDYYTQEQDECDGTPIIDLYGTAEVLHANDLTGTGYEADLFRDRILSIVEDRVTSTPLFLYYAPHLVHTPHEGVSL